MGRRVRQAGDCAACPGRVAAGQAQDRQALARSRSDVEGTFERRHPEGMVREVPGRAQSSRRLQQDLRRGQSGQINAVAWLRARDALEGNTMKAFVIAFATILLASSPAWTQ